MLEHITLTKLNVPKSNTKIIWAPIFEFCVVRCGSKTWHQEDSMSLEEIGLRAQNMIGLNRQHDWATI
jgi:hypothetical protein